MWDEVLTVPVFLDTTMYFIMGSHAAKFKGMSPTTLRQIMIRKWVDQPFDTCAQKVHTAVSSDSINLIY